MSNSNKCSKKFDAIVCLSAIDWDFLWQRTQEIMSQFSSMGYPVLFIENTGVRIPNLRDIPRVLARAKKYFRKKKTAQVNSRNNVEIYSPMVVPIPYFPLIVKWNARILVKRILNFCQTHGIMSGRILFWTYMTTPLAVEVASARNWAGLVVDLVSDPSKVPGAQKIKHSHEQMLKLADVILCASLPVVQNTKQYLDTDYSNKIRLFEDGFSVRLRDSISDNEPEITVPAEWLDKPIVAYIGGINEKIWWNAVSVMADKFPNVCFMLMGPKEIQDIPCRGFGRNVFWHPPFTEYHQLGEFLKKCKAGIIPYVNNSYVSEMRPAKINEYLVTEIPIVSTSLPEIERFARECGDGIIYLADTAEQFAIALEKALADDCEEFRKKRWEIACNRSWESICQKLESQLQRL